ncbi:hypothetical protein LV75_000826 [Actinokineospora diospyrosa]|uniref:Uncharacterized protein n=1 Tax=Actinokineospora diospyrosa TaxID=103728 RepID=A0ABT1I6U5_9PSEU|nr:hypothetical protein [Actinokineospora diospyrosa]
MATLHHIAGCPDCARLLEGVASALEMLGEVPPEFFIHGPPEDGELLLHRVLREVRLARDE